MSRSATQLRIALLAGVALAACGGDDSASVDAATESTANATDTGTGADTGTETDMDTDGEAAPRRCVAPEGMGSPTTIAAALELLGALPEPVTVACVVESLDRPLAINATSSTFSAQPAAGGESPRIFIFVADGALLLSVVPDGDGAPLLEFGQASGYAEGESLKGELHMPVALPIPADKPYAHLRYTEAVTSCGVCHRDERLAAEIDHPNAFVSRALRPDPMRDVPLAELELEWTLCDADATPERCAVLDAVFNHGPVEARDFPEDFATIFDP
ncbi:MAG: hypothetical protein KC486_00850 [Myxococcales bacterium]|nr:hypothetical protein [Myxococcales bacterium]